MYLMQKKRKILESTQKLKNCSSSRENKKDMDIWKIATEEAKYDQNHQLSSGID